MAVFYSFTAGAGLLDFAQLETQEITKIEGQWYEPTQMQKGNIELKLLKNKSTNRIDLVEITKQDSEFTPKDGAEYDREYYQISIEPMWLIRSYNYRYSKELDRLVPMRIDIFDIRNGLASKQLIIQIDYKTILKKKGDLQISSK